ncbi:MAG: MoaD/ThiS family protein [Thermosphaera aggregans]|jgi:MoaD family protein
MRLSLGKHQSLHRDEEGMAKVRVKYFLWLADKAGCSLEEVMLDNSTLFGLMEHIKATRPKLSKIIESILQGSSEIIVLVNDRSPKTLNLELKDGDEVVLMPPVSGG